MPGGGSELRPIRGPRAPKTTLVPLGPRPHLRSRPLGQVLAAVPPQRYPLHPNGFSNENRLRNPKSSLPRRGCCAPYVSPSPRTSAVLGERSAVSPASSTASLHRSSWRLLKTSAPLSPYEDAAKRKLSEIPLLRNPIAADFANLLNSGNLDAMDHAVRNVVLNPPRPRSYRSSARPCRRPWPRPWSWPYHGHVQGPLVRALSEGPY